MAPVSASHGRSIRSITVLAPVDIVVSCVGNSLMYGQGASPGENIPVYLSELLDRSTTYNFGHGNYQTPELTDLLATEGASVFNPLSRNILMLLEGGNHMYYGASPATALTAYATFVSTARSLGWSDLIGTYTLSPREYANQLTAQDITDFNTSLRSGWSGLGFDFLVDTGDAPELAVPGSGDLTHLDGSQYYYMATATASAIADFFSSEPESIEMANIVISQGKALPSLLLPASGTVSWQGVVRGSRLSVYAAWTGTPTGVFSLQSSFDGGQTWITTPGASTEFTAQPAGGASSGLWNWINVPGTLWRLLYTATSGTGTLTGFAADGN